MSFSLLARGVLAALSRAHSTLASSSSAAAQATGAASANAVRRGTASMPAVAESDGESSSSHLHHEESNASPRWLRELGVVRNDWT